MSSVEYEVRPCGGIWEVAIARARALVGRHGAGRVVVRDATGAVEGEYVHDAGVPPRSHR